MADLNKYLDKLRISDADFYRKGTRASKMGLPGSSTDKSQRSTQDQVLDPRTRMILLKMINKAVFDEIGGCISTGKEANVYRAVILSPPQQLAVKVYKTAILAFKDRERYVVGEYRFRFGYAKNPRKMVKLWAEKETRNLKRIFKSDIPVPKPLHLNNHVLVMEFLGDEAGFASPKLKDAEIPDQEYPKLYHQLCAYMRIMYQECRLVHADLSEYNILYHQQKLWIIDVSQSVEHDHPMSLEFLRMDIKNVNGYFSKFNVEILNERQLFKFITDLPQPGGQWPELVSSLVENLEKIPREEMTEQMRSDDAVFREVYIPRNLNDVFDIERDVEKVVQGKHEDLIYHELLHTNNVSGEAGDIEGAKVIARKASDASDASDAKVDKTVDPKVGTKLDTEDNDYCEDVNSDNSDGSDSSSDSSSSDEETDVWDQQWESKHAIKERKFKDRDANKERKKAIKEQQKAKRQTKMKKKDKKKLVAQSKTSSKLKK